MDISPASQTYTTAAATLPETAVASDYETFLLMLTTQMQNQDPLDPVDSSDFAVQLATFAGVEQQTLTNDLLADLNAQFGMMSMAQLAAWVGQEARAAVPVHYDGAPVSLSPDPAPSADRAVLVVTDSGGRLVSREDVPVSTDSYQWLGADAAGNPLPTGLYALSLESYAGETLIASTPVESYALILEAQGGPGGTQLLLAGGVKVAAESVTALRIP